MLFIASEENEPLIYSIAKKTSFSNELGQILATYYKRISKNDFLIKIGNNFFSKDSISLNIANGHVNLIGKITMQNHVELITDKSNERKKIMGWYYKVPFMECYHGVVSLNHDLKGGLTLNNIQYQLIKIQFNYFK